MEVSMPAKGDGFGGRIVMMFHAITGNPTKHKCNRLWVETIQQAPRKHRRGGWLASESQDNATNIHI
jgi:hypothetical protein